MYDQNIITSIFSLKTIDFFFLYELITYYYIQFISYILFQNFVIKNIFMGFKSI